MYFFFLFNKYNIFSFFCLLAAAPSAPGAYAYALGVFWRHFLSCLSSALLKCLMSAAEAWRYLLVRLAGDSRFRLCSESAATAASEAHNKASSTGCCAHSVFVEVLRGRRELAITGYMETAHETHPTCRYLQRPTSVIY